MATKKADWEKEAKKKSAAPTAAEKRMAEKAAKAGKTAQAIVANEKPYEYPKGWKAPKNTAIGADAYYMARNARLLLQKDVDALEVTEQALKHWLIKQLPKGDASGAAGKLARVSIVIKDIPRADDWPTVYSNIVAEYAAHQRKKDGLQDSAFALLGKALTAPEIKNRWKDGKTIPGIGVFHKADLSVNKL